MPKLTQLATGYAIEGLTRPTDESNLNRCNQTRMTIIPIPPSGSVIRTPIRRRMVGEFIGTVVSNDWVNKEYKHIVLRVHEQALKAYAGQMFHLLCPSPDGAEVWMRRPMSIYRVDKAAGQVEFLYKIEGRGTRGIAMLEPGDDFNIAGPLGSWLQAPTAWKSIVVLGRGVGLATLAPLSQLAAEHGVGVTAILSARHPGVVMSKGSIREALAPARSLWSIPTTVAPSRMSAPSRGPDRSGQSGCVLYLRLQPASDADEDPRKGA